MTREYPSDWDTRRKAIYQRDEYQCQHCGRRGGPLGNAELHAHHIVPKSRGGSHSPKNLITLCQQCHSQVHGRPVGNYSNPSNPYSSSNNSRSTIQQEESTGDLGTAFDNIRLLITVGGILALVGFGLPALFYLIKSPSEASGMLVGLGAIILGLAMIWPSKVLDFLGIDFDL